MTATTDGVIWDLTSYFPEFDGSAMQEFKEKLRRDIAEIQQQAFNLGSLGEKTADRWERIILSAEDIESRLGHLSSYLSCLEAADAQNESYSRERAELINISAEFEKFDVDILHAFKSSENDFFENFVARGKLKDIAYALRKSRERARHIMSREEEILAADLNTDGLRAWGRLYNKVTGKLEFEFITKEGKTERRPMSQWRSLISDPDRAIGRAAFEGGNRAWKGIEDICAAALNAIAGTRLSLYRHRGIKHFLDKALFQAGIRHETLEAMYQAIYDNIEVARDILRTKAGFLGRKGIWFFEREAPLPVSESSIYSWQQATEMVDAAFQIAYPALAEYFRGFLKSRWIESEARPGKRPGAFCTGSSVTKEQRVYMTFNGNLNNVTTIAHEVGHAWHGHLMRDMRPMSEDYPMTLAETASIFAEHILAEGIYENDSIPDTEKMLMLDADLCGAAVLLLDITTRYEFEKAFHMERQSGEVPVSRLQELMTATQHRIFGDTLLADGADPYFWASKLHFYITDIAFYNFPYTFGFLLARALIHRFYKEGSAFLPRYEMFLKMAGSDTVENVTRDSLEVDVSTADFWAESIRSLGEPLERYKRFIQKSA
ncbi:M3 family oligoendopeptidase [Thermodesulfobacteriota bacterium]